MRVWRNATLYVKGYRCGAAAGTHVRTGAVHSPQANCGLAHFLNVGGTHVPNRISTLQDEPDYVPAVRRLSTLPLWATVTRECV